VRKPCAICLTLFAAFVIQARSQESAPLRLVQTIPMPGVHGRMDHLAVDIEGKRLFAAALGDNQNTVEVLDLEAGKRVFSIPGQSKPQGVFYSADFKRLFVANGGGGESIVTGEGTVKIFAGDTYKLLDSFPVGTDADHVGYDPATKYLYVGVGTSKSGALAIIDTRTNKHIGDIETPAGPGGIMMEKSGGPRIFVKYRRSATLGVVDREKRKVIATWPVTGVQTVGSTVAAGTLVFSSGPLALDESHHRLFDMTRNPPMLLVFDTETGKQITQLEGVPGNDDLWYDAAHKRIYSSGGRESIAGSVPGFVYVYQQGDADHYELIAKVPTRPNAQTSIWVPEFNRYYVSASGNDKQDAAILVFEPQP
jgi:hypothetical protein